MKLEIRPHDWASSFVERENFHEAKETVLELVGEEAEAFDVVQYDKRGRLVAAFVPRIELKRLTDEELENLYGEEIRWKDQEAT